MMQERRVTRQRSAAALAIPKIQAQTRDSLGESASKPARAPSGNGTKSSGNIRANSRSTPLSRISSASSKTLNRKSTTETSDGSSTTPKRMKRKTPGSDMEKILLDIKKSGAAAERIREANSMMKEVRKDLDKVVDQAKRDSQLQEERESIKKPAKSTRSGLKRGAMRRIDEYTQGKIILIGMQQAKNKTPFDEVDLNHLKTEVPRKKQVRDLRFEHLQYLVSYVFLPELKSIQRGETKSEFHDRYNQLVGKSKNELYSEMRLTLFTNEQRDYLNGYLQEIFDANKKDDSGDINHTLINYVELVMLYETTLRIVRYVHKFETFEETLDFMKKKSREAYGIDDDDDDED